ncbi:probable leucine-rich repeat receptor-like protein kinase [Tanacetum coccineum]
MHLQEPFIFNQDPGENSSQSPPHIDHHCCYECGDLLDDIFCQRCTASLVGKCKVVVCGGMEHGFLSQKGSGGGRGVKEKDLNRNKKNTSSGIGVSTDSEDTMNDDTPIGVASTESFPPLSTPVITTPGNAPESIRAINERFANTTYGFFLGKRVAYPVVANYVRNTWGKYGLVRSMFSSSTRLFSFQFSSMDGLDALLENGPWFIQNNPLILKKWHPDVNLLKEDVSTPLMLDSYTTDVCMQSWGRSSYARAMIELRANVELKDNTMVAMPKITGEGHYTCAGETKTMKKPNQTSRGVPVGPKVGFKPHKEYRPIPKKPNASSSGNKNKGVEPTIEISNSNAFKVLNSIDNNVELGTSEGTTNLVNNKANSSGSSFMNVDNSSTGTTPIIDKIRKFEDLLSSGQTIFVDDAGNPLRKVEFLGDYDSEDEVASVDNDMARSLASERVGFGTQSLLE